MLLQKQKSIRSKDQSKIQILPLTYQLFNLGQNAYLNFSVYHLKYVHNRILSLSYDLNGHGQQLELALM